MLRAYIFHPVCAVAYTPGRGVKKEEYFKFMLFSFCNAKNFYSNMCSTVMSITQVTWYLCYPTTEIISIFFLVRTYWKICFILFKLSKPFAYNGWEVSWLEKRNAQFLGILRCLLCWYIEISYEDIQSHETDEVQVFVAQMVVSHQVWLFTSYFYAKSILSIQMDWRGNCI